LYLNKEHVSIDPFTMFSYVHTYTTVTITLVNLNITFISNEDIYIYRLAQVAQEVI